MASVLKRFLNLRALPAALMRTNRTNIRMESIGLRAGVQYSQLSHYSKRSLQEHEVDQNINDCVPIDDLKLEQIHIDEAIKLEPHLSGIPLELWHRSHQMFLNHGLDTTSFLRIVTGNPSILKRSPKKIVECLEFWRSCQFGEKLMHLLITKYPELLNVSDGNRLLKHIAYLKTFAKTDKNVWKLLMNCPNLLEQSEATIERKIEYLTKEMRIEMPEIAKSEALSKQFDEIRCRLVFLDRLGLFKLRSLKANWKEPNNNPRLYQITDTSEKTFATKICHVRLEEFETFKILYERERRRKREDEEEDLTDDEY